MELILSILSSIISILTPIILILWFCYSQKQILSKNYYSEINGQYAGYTDPICQSQQNGKVFSGIIMDIKHIDNKGFFKGEFKYGETESIIWSGQPHLKNLASGIFSFWGKINYKWYRSKVRNPFSPNENRTYCGTLYIVDRLDFQFENYKMEDYLSAEYNFEHFREMQTMKFKLRTTHREYSAKLPASFTLYKSNGFDFEPYKTLKTVVFYPPR